MSMDSLLLFGSLAYDHLLKTSQKFREALPSNSEHFHMSVLTQEYAKTFGGVAGNIAYYLNVLNFPSTILTAIGEDGGEYVRYLKNLGVSTEALYHSAEKTATAHIITDVEQNQFISFHPGALIHADRCDVREHEPKLVCISPNGDKEAMRLTVRRCREKNIPYVFDPGQMIPLWSGEELIEDISTAHLVILNEYEYEMAQEKLTITHERMEDISETLIVTLGDAGSKLIVPEASSCHVIAAVPEAIVNSTGCGDAYRAGVLYSIMNDTDLVLGMKVGTILASFAIESDETQNQSITLEKVKERLEKTFQENLDDHL